MFLYALGDDEVPPGSPQAKALEIQGILRASWPRARMTKFPRAEVLQVVDQALALVGQTQKDTNQAIDWYKGYPGDWVAYLREQRTQVDKWAGWLRTFRDRIFYAKTSVVDVGRIGGDYTYLKDTIDGLLINIRVSYATMWSVGKNATSGLGWLLGSYVMNFLGMLGSAIKAVGVLLEDIYKTIKEVVKRTVDITDKSLDVMKWGIIVGGLYLVYDMTKRR